MKLPEQYLSKMQELLNDEYEDYLHSFAQEPIHSLRINTNKISVKDFLKINPFNLEPIPWTSDGFYYQETDRPSKHPYYYAGLYYLQEASAMLPAEVLPIEENEIILDACAAPGGKSSKLANKLNHTGILYANDISVSRAQILLKTLENQGIGNAYVMANDINELDRFHEHFDKILIDAPCSGEGMFRKEQDLIRSWLDKGNEYYASLQKQIIAKAISLLKPGGKLVYSTCTFSPLEDEQVIEYALDNHPDMQVVPFKKYPGFRDGLTDRTKDCARLYPHCIKGEGHFVALLEKAGEKTPTLRKETVEDMPTFLEPFLSETNKGKLVQRENRYYLEPQDNIDLKGLRILRSGLYLGEMKHERFEPAIALALGKNRFKNILNLELEDQRVIKYLKCETLDVKDKHLEGLTLVCVDGYPLGFGMISKGLLKNKYPANYRYI